MNILHVDDSPEICQLYADMLAIGNNTVKSVNDGREGLELVLKNDYDLILLDVCMPKYSGINFIHDLKAKRPSEMKKIVIISVLQLREGHKKRTFETWNSFSGRKTSNYSKARSNKERFTAM